MSTLPFNHDTTKLPRNSPSFYPKSRFGRFKAAQADINLPSNGHCSGEEQVYGAMYYDE